MNLFTSIHVHPPMFTVVVGPQNCSIQMEPIDYYRTWFNTTQTWLLVGAGWYSVGPSQALLAHSLTQSLPLCPLVSMTNLHGTSREWL